MAYFSAYRLPTRSLSQTVCERENQERQSRGSRSRSRDDSGGELADDLLDKSNGKTTKDDE